MFEQTAYQFDPRKFYALAKIIGEITENDLLRGEADFIQTEVWIELEKIASQRNELARANNHLFQEIRLATKRSPFSSFEEQEQDFEKFSHTLKGQNFLRVFFECTNILTDAFSVLNNICVDLYPRDLLVSKVDYDFKSLDFDQLQKMSFESQLNQGTIARFISAIKALENGQKKLIEISDAIIDVIDAYYKTLNQRHVIDGIKVCQDPILTDLAISVYENIDAHGEIESGKSPDEVSAYTMRKAEIIINAVKKPNVSKYILPDALLNFLVDKLSFLWTKCSKLNEMYKELFIKVNDVVNVRKKPASQTVSDASFYSTIQTLKDLNPHSIKEKESVNLLTSEERFNNQFRDETISKIVESLQNVNEKPIDLITYILNRKAQLRSYFQDENSFYVCRIGAGNAFLGEAPGTLTVVPGSKPNINLEDIVGSGFSEIRKFVGAIEAAEKWHDLFVATSPSKTADKSNVLLVGPMGCGKTEALRAVASDRQSIGIFAQGSDFMTCWKGEAEKNPKRLFEAAVKLQRESKKHVHILIDEIDSVLKKQELTQHGEFNLTLEFQILMDGLVHYKGISVWGTTNHPERLPMPMLRRFSLVSIVGELSKTDRITLLKHYMSRLPLSNFSDEIWEELANKLEGATGDVVRKVCDKVWRNFMLTFVKQYPDKADKIIKWLNSVEKFDISKFTADQKNQLKQMLGQTVTPNDLRTSVSSSLENLAIKSEIETAIRSYKIAKQLVSEIGK